MKYTVDLPHDLPNGTSVRIQYGAHFLGVPVFKGSTFNFEGIPIYANPSFTPRDPFKDAKLFAVGADYHTANGCTVRPIARHADGDYEVTVIKMALVLSEKCEQRGMRVGSSYVVDKFGEVKPGHLAPPSSMSLKEKVHKFTDEMIAWGQGAFSKTDGAAIQDEPNRVRGPTPERDPISIEFVRAADVMNVNTAKKGWLLDLITEIAKKEVCQLAKDVAQVRADIRPEIDAALKKYDAQRLKLFVGKTYVTRNGSQVKLTERGAGIRDGLIYGEVVRGGTVERGFKDRVDFLEHNGEFASAPTKTKDHPLDILHEVL